MKFIWIITISAKIVSALWIYWYYIIFISESMVLFNSINYLRQNKHQHFSTLILFNVEGSIFFIMNYWFNVFLKMHYNIWVVLFKIPPQPDNFKKLKPTRKYFPLEIRTHMSRWFSKLNSVLELLSSVPLLMNRVCIVYMYKFHKVYKL